MPDPIYYYRYAETSSRLTSDQEQVEQAVALMFRCLHHKGQDYSSLLERAPAETPRRVDPAVLWLIAEGRMWSGRRARMAGRALRRAVFPRNRQQAKDWLYLLWGSVSPKSLRRLLSMRAAHRLRRTEGQYQDGELYEWRSEPAVTSAH